MKEKKANSGTSKTSANSNGTRRKHNGKELAPRSVRRLKGVKYLSECTDKDLEHAKITR